MTHTASIFLPWPDRRLSPNARVHWSSLARAKKQAKRDAYYTMLEAGIGRIEAESISIKYSFFPPDRRARDADNMLSSCKAYQDGIAAAIGVDDSKFQITIAPRGPIERSGMVKVELEWGA
jgi:crossover junction endodeoxyribonuclease RusA